MYKCCKGNVRVLFALSLKKKKTYILNHIRNYFPLICGQYKTFLYILVFDYSTFFLIILLTFYNVFCFISCTYFSTFQQKYKTDLLGIFTVCLASHQLSVAGVPYNSVTALIFGIWSILWSSACPYRMPYLQCHFNHHNCSCKLSTSCCLNCSGHHPSYFYFGFLFPFQTLLGKFSTYIDCIIIITCALCICRKVRLPA